MGGTALTYPRVMSMLLTIPATFVLLGAAVLSIFRFLRKKEFAYRVWANVLIAAGTLVIASGGGMAKAGNTTMFYLAEMVAAVLFFAGFLLAGTLQKGADEIRAPRQERRASSSRAAAHGVAPELAQRVRARPSAPPGSPGARPGCARRLRSPRR